MEFFVICGETSGDLHLSYLLEAIQKKDQTMRFSGVCGEKCRAIGVNQLLDIQEINIMGFVEVIKKYRYLKEKAQEFIDYIEKNAIKNVLLVDYGGFNLQFVKMLRAKFGDAIEIFYYIPPKVWVWGKKRLKTLKLVDHIMVIFPWEKPFYASENMDVTYFGNPLVDEIFPRQKSGEKILLLPGSRNQELNTILPIMKEIVSKLPNEQFVLKIANASDREKIEAVFDTNTNVEVCSRSLSALALEVKASIATSGTVILELALLNIPTVVVYKTSKINEFIARVIIKIQFVSLPNIALNKAIFPEMLQKKCNPIGIITALNEVSETDYSVDFKNLRALLGECDIIDQYADFVIKKGI